MKKRNALIVLGMHRSGTSALAGSLRFLGVNLGEYLLEPNQSNIVGYFEHQSIYQIHEKLLQELNSSWDDVRNLPDD